MSWTVTDVMTKDVVAVGPGAGFKECVRLLRVHRISALPVISKDCKLLGIVSEADLLAKEEQRGSEPGGFNLGGNGRRASAWTAEDLMTSPAIAVGPAASVPEAARLMHRRRIKRLPVIDAEGRLVGIVSRSDLLKTFMRSDESIRREVADQLLRKTLFIDPNEISVEVNDGLVRLSGELETKSLADLVVRLVERAEGTVGVDSNLTYRFDDSSLHVGLPSNALQLSAQERRT
jgi:CBS-domain-containing membrane protein